MRGKLTLLAGVCAGAIAMPAFAQTAPKADATSDVETIVVTAQRTSEKLQNVPIAVSAFNSEALDKQQIKNTSDLQLSLPNVTFTKTNFTSSSFTIRGIGDLCVGTTCDSATAIHINDAPQFNTRLFEGEFYDMGQIEVLRGPQGTLFGRNATSGVVNFKTAKPDLTGTHVSAEGDYGNYNGIKLKAMLNYAITPTLGIRLAGFGLKRDGYTLNLNTNSRIDDRNEYGYRGSLRWEPTDSTKINLMGQFFHEQDHRMRSQKQACQTDPTGILGCLNAVTGSGLTNANSTFTGVLSSKQFFATQGIPTSLALGDLYGPNPYLGVVNPADPRVVNAGVTPQYYARETVLQGEIEQELGKGLDLKVQGNYQNVAVDSSQDYNNAIQNRAVLQPGLNTLAALAAGAGGAALASYLKPIASALMPNGPAGVLCTSLPEETGTGIYGGHSICSMNPLQLDRSDQFNTSWTGEAILSSKWDGKFNFLLGGIYGKLNMTENSYYVDSTQIDYITGILGAFTSYAKGLPASYLGTPTYRNNTNSLKITTYGLFGETYYKFSDKIKLTVGLRYNNDDKNVSARTTLASFLVPFGSTNAYTSPYIAAFDADPSIAGNQLYAIAESKSSAVTGRGVIDFQITPRNLLYMSYSRGYKSGGINPPLSPVFSVPTTFGPEHVNAFEIGSKNTFGAAQINLTAFYYKYKDLQLSRIVARTSVNDNVDANIYGLEAEGILRPIRPLTINVNASYLHTAVANDKMLANPRDFGAGRADAVIIKDITNGANCAVASNSGNVAGVNAFVNTANSYINAGAITGVAAGAGLQPTTAFGANSGIASTGAFSICAVLSALAPTVGAAPGVGGVTVYSSGIPVDIKGNQLPGAPNYKVSAGIQYEIPMGSASLTPRFDAILTGTSTGSIFNGVANRVPSYTQLNAQIELAGPERGWFLRAYVQNLSNSSPITGLYVTDQSSGNYTNIFTLEPRRYGIAAGMKF